MRRLLVLTVVGASIFIGSNPTKADWDSIGAKNGNLVNLAIPEGYPGAMKSSNVTEIYSYNSETGVSTLLNTYQHCDGSSAYNTDTSWKCEAFDYTKSTLNSNSNSVEFKSSAKNKSFVYDITNNSWSEKDYTSPHSDAYSKSFQKSIEITDSNGNKSIQITGSKLIEEKTNGSIQIGTDTNDIDITEEGLNIDGNPLITKKDNGEIHIGKNSLITKSEEETLSDGTKVQPLYAKDADGNKIPINIDGSKLLIDGVEVTAGGGSAQVNTNKNNISTNKSNIKNLGEGVAGSTALTAALTALPQTSKESKLSCGVGSGAYSSRYAVGFGCASKVNERVDINAGGSYVFGGSKSYGEGTLDSGVLKAGFVFKLGELNKSTQFSMKDKKVMETKIESLEEKNKTILSKNQKLENKLSILMARLERIENIALSESKSQDLAVYKLK